MLGVIGDLVEDIVVWLNEPIRYGSDTDVDVFRVRGGSAANVAAMAARACRTRFFGCVGDDPSGDGIVRSLKESQVDVRVQRRGRTGTIVILVDADGERTMLPDRGASTLIRTLTAEDLAGVALLHVSSYSFQGTDLRHEMEGTLALAAQMRVDVSIDASSEGLIESFGREEYIALLQRFQPHILFANRDEARALGLENEDSALVGALPRTTFVLKRGADATKLIRHGRATLSVTVPPVAGVRDSIGAGDAFAAGFLSGYLTHGDFMSACKDGHAFAAEVLRTPGAGGAPLTATHSAS